MANKPPTKSNFPTRPFFDEDDGELEFVAAPALPGVPSDVGDPLYTIYGVHPGLPFRIKVEQLIILWDLNVDEIVNATQEPKERVELMVNDLKRGWMALGEGLNEEDKILARGKMIKELLRLKNELEQLGATQDSKLISMKINLAEKIAKLRGIETDRKEAPVEDTRPANPIEEALSKLSPEMKKSLLERLSKP